jgi:hypothetical protein
VGAWARHYGVGDTLQFVENIAAVVEADIPDDRRPPSEADLFKC